MTSRSACNILITGRPGAGKTTVIQRLAESLPGLTVAGFCTAELRERGRRRGFSATTFSGGSCALAHCDFRTPHRVGRYGVDVEAFEQLVLPELTRAADVMLIDEIGKMECFSPRFVERVRSLLDGATPVVATVAVKGGGFIAEAKSRPDVELWNVSGANRDELPRRIVERVTADE